MKLLCSILLGTFVHNCFEFCIDYGNSPSIKHSHLSNKTRKTKKIIQKVKPRQRAAIQPSKSTMLKALFLIITGVSITHQAQAVHELAQMEQRRQEFFEKQVEENKKNASKRLDERMDGLEPVQIIKLLNAIKNTEGLNGNTESWQLNLNTARIRIMQIKNGFLNAQDGKDFATEANVILTRIWKKCVDGPDSDDDRDEDGDTFMEDP